MHAAMMAQIAKEKEMDSLLGGFDAGSQQQQHHTAAARRRLMSVDDAGNEHQLQEEIDSSSTVITTTGGWQDENVVSTGRQLLQDGAAGGADQPVAAGVESDPTNAGLSQEALDSFKLFDAADPDANADTGEAATCMASHVQHSSGHFCLLAVHVAAASTALWQPSLPL